MFTCDVMRPKAGERHRLHPLRKAHRVDRGDEIRSGIGKRAVEIEQDQPWSVQLRRASHGRDQPLRNAAR